jgi:Leucine-rich repeat (LRR) protein
MSLFLVEERQMAEGLYNHEIEMSESDCNRGDDVANTLIQSALNYSSDGCSSKYQFNQPILPPTLCISEIEGIKLSSHHNLLDLDLSNNKITKVDGLEALKCLKRYEFMTYSFSPLTTGLIHLQHLHLFKA